VGEAGDLMYQPAHGRFAVPDPVDVLADLCRRVPATLVSLGSDGFRTSILPMLFDPAEGETGTLRGHLARANPHWRSFSVDAHAIAIFNGADAYISPAWYEEKRLTGKVVPTWNYLTVVVHGAVATHQEVDWLVPHVRRLVNRHESGRADPWSIDDAPQGYIETMARAIVGLELRIERIDAKRKLSQNRSAADIAGAIAGLSSGSADERATAELMLDMDAEESG
jgi:transcriptional regulator